MNKVTMDSSGKFNCHKCNMQIQSTRENTNVSQSGNIVFVWVDCPECGTNHQFESTLNFTFSSDTE